MVTSFKKLVDLNHVPDTLDLRSGILIDSPTTDAARAWERALIILAEHHPLAARSVEDAIVTININGYDIAFDGYSEWAHTIYDHLVIIRCAIREAFDEMGHDIAANIRKCSTWPAITVSSITSIDIPGPRYPEQAPIVRDEMIVDLADEAASEGMTETQIKAAMIFAAATSLRDDIVAPFNDGQHPVPSLANLITATEEMEARLCVAYPDLESVRVCAANIATMALLLSRPDLTA